MESISVSKLPLIVIVGPTASGKTSLAIDLARQHHGEIICADSRTIYREMNIGTAKPTSEEQSRVPHWGVDIVDPGERFTAADFKRYAVSKIAEIRGRGHIPFLVGGTGLYVDSVIFDYEFGAINDSQRKRLQNLSIDELHEYCIKNNIMLPENRLNKRYVIRAIEQKNIKSTRTDEPIENTIIVGITTDKEMLRGRIVRRSEQIFDDGVVEEAISLGKKYGWDNEAMTGNVYPLVHDFVENRISSEEMKLKLTVLDWRLAKRQLTWLRRNQYIHWRNLEDARSYIESRLANEQ